MYSELQFTRGQHRLGGSMAALWASFELPPLAADRIPHKIAPLRLLLCLLFFVFAALLLWRSRSTSHSALDVVESPRVAKEETVEEEVCDAANAPGNWFIYCTGRILSAVNHHRIFNESKLFVYRPLVRSAVEVRDEFESLFPVPIEEIDPTELFDFVSRNFAQSGADLISVTPTDWTARPPRITAIRNGTMREWALELNAVWPRLVRRVAGKAAGEPDRHSLLYLPNSFVVPSEKRFKEMYYWDSYWVLKGLWVSGMLDTAKGILRNLLYLIDRYGFVPNGSRVYHLRRSQPPFLCLMVDDYISATNDSGLLVEALPRLEREMAFWRERRTVEVNVPSFTPLNGGNRTVGMFRYRADSNQPWPEDYMNQLQLAAGIRDENERRRLFRELATDAESGLDHSSRWMRQLPSDLTSIETSHILPVDLNALLCGNYALMAEFHALVRNHSRSEHYSSLHRQFLTDFRSMFYRDDDAAAPGWYDFKLRTGSHNNLHFYASSAVPLFTHCYDASVDPIERVYEHWLDTGVLDFPGGVPSGDVQSGQQWDAPNGWAPANHMLIEGLWTAGNAKLRAAGRKLALKWLESNYRVWRTTGYMWEKYNVSSSVPSPGGGGKYRVEPGFGWTNGVVLELLTNGVLD